MQFWERFFKFVKFSIYIIFSMLSKILGPSSIWNLRTTNSIKTRGVSHCDLEAIYIKKYLKAKEELWKLKYFSMQKYNLQKIL